MKREDSTPYPSLVEQVKVYRLLLARCYEAVKSINSNNSLSVDLILSDHELYATAAVDATLSKLKSDGWIAFRVSGKGKQALRIIDPYAPFWRRLLARFVPLLT